MNDLIFHNCTPIFDAVKDEGESWLTPSNFLYSNDVVYIVGRYSLYIYNLKAITPNNEIEVLKISTGLASPSTDLKELHGKYLAFGVDNKIVLVDVNSKEIKRLPLPHVSLSFNEGSQLASITDDGKVETWFVEEFGELVKLGECTLAVENPKNEYINLGWGSESTQFRGRRVARGEGAFEDPTRRHPLDAKPPTITWSETNDMFAVNFCEDNKRLIKIFSCDCTLLYKTGPIADMQSVTAWKPPHSVIAVPVWSDDYLEIHLYEKLGPLRDHFPILHPTEIIKMQWSDDGLLLGIMQHNSLNIYMPKSGRWYLKQHLNFNWPHELVTFNFFKTERNNLYRLGVLTAKGFFIYTFILGLNVVPLTAAKSELALCAVTDGSTVEIYNFTEKIHPPSKPYATIQAQNPITAVKFHPIAHKILLLDSNSNVTVYSYDDKKYNLEATYTILGNTGLAFTCQEIFWRIDGLPEFLVRENSSPYDTINDADNKDLIKVPAGLWKKQYMKDGEKTIEKYLKQVNIKCKNGNLLNTFNYGTNSIKEEGITVDGKEYLFSLLENRRLYLNNTEISKYVSSFIIHDGYLHFTTAHLNQLRIIVLNKENMTEIENGRFSPTRFPGRTVETGAVLVIGLPKKPEVVLQMPRGNLETIKIEMILMDVVDELINTGNWLGAHDYIRMQKMDSNILIDLNCLKFLQDIDKFIGGIGSPSLLSQVIEELSESNGSCDTYFTHYPQKRRYVPPGSKLKCVCDKFIDALKKSGSLGNYLLPVISASILRDPIDGLSDCFRHMAILLDVYGDRKEIVSSIVDGVKYLKNKFIEKQLFDCALRTFHFKLVQITADAINKDPREYRPLLKNLEGLDVVELRFQVFDYIGDRKRALPWLIRKGEKKKTLEYILEYGLLDVGLTELPLEETDETAMRLSKGCSRVLSKKMMDKLAFAFRVAVQTGPVESFPFAKRTNLWQEAFELSAGLEIDERIKNLDVIAQRMSDNREILEAAAVYTTLEDYAKGFEVLILGNRLVEALCFVEEYFMKDSRRDLDELLSEKLNSVTKVYLEKLKVNLIEMKSKFKSYYDRLVTVRVNKNVDRMMAEDIEDDASLYAESSIASTRSTIQTRTTSRQRRKIEKKVLSLRAGSKYEDVALHAALRDVMDNIFIANREIAQLMTLSNALNGNFDEEIEEYCNNLGELQAIAECKVEEIWCREEILNNENYFFLGSRNKTPPTRLSSRWFDNVYFAT